MGTYIGILSGRHELDTVLGTMRSMGLDVVAMPERGEDWAAIRHSRNHVEPFRVSTDERHYTFKERLDHPHTIVEISHRLGTEQTVRALVGRFGGWVREMGQREPEVVRADADVENPSFDLRVDLQEVLPEEEYRLVRALARVGREDPEALRRARAVIDVYLERLAAAVDEPEASGPSPR
jgi:hypothetical protein